MNILFIYEKKSKLIFLLYISDNNIEIFSNIIKCNRNAIRCFIDSIDI